MPQGATIRVSGLADLERAFSRADRELSHDLRDALAESAAPVRTEAQVLAGMAIGKPTDPWASMRIGVRRSIVWVAPTERGVKGRGNQRFRRPKFGDFLLDRAMIPALERNVNKVEDRFERMVDEVLAVWERGV